MVFTSVIFLFAFLPLTLLCYYASPEKFKNACLLLFSLLFYAWGEVFYMAVMLSSIVCNYICSCLMERWQKRYLSLWLGISINLLLLVSFKYANFLVENINILFKWVAVDQILLPPVHLPLGISFFTFQAISYLVDVYKRNVPAQKNLVYLALYISLFPQLIAGPIVRYHDIVQQLTARRHSLCLFSEGIRRFIIGVSKKMLIANPLGEVADLVFTLPEHELTFALAWIGVATYTLQLYFDFSGYSDMAIGLGKMFGFHFLENFNYPYIARSIREFWQRWHISLSTWFRDYLYIPLGGNRQGRLRTYGNLFVVFSLTGIWHGASWNFLIWGWFHGVFLALEHAGLSHQIKRCYAPLQHVYVIVVVMIGWVFFRAESMAQLNYYLLTLFDTSKATTAFQYAQILSYEAAYAFVLGCLFCAPVLPRLQQFFSDRNLVNCYRCLFFYQLAGLMVLLAMFLLSIMKIAASTYNPFIYFRF